jgi:hypothetical protein
MVDLIRVYAGLVDNEYSIARIILRFGKEAILKAETVSSLPKHDQICWSRQLFSIFFIAAATSLLIWYTVRLATSMEASYWWLPLGHDEIF